MTGGLKVYYVPWKPFITIYGLLPIIRTILIRERITDHSLYGFSDVGSIHMNKVLQFTLAYVSQAKCVSHTTKENTVLRSGLPPEKVFVVPNAVDTAIFKPAVDRPSRSEIVIVVISWLVYRKGVDLIVEVIPEVCRLHPNVSCSKHCSFVYISTKVGLKFCSAQKKCQQAKLEI